MYLLERVEIPVDNSPREKRKLRAIVVLCTTEIYPELNDQCVISW